MFKLTKKDINDFFDSKFKVFKGKILLLRLRKTSKENFPRFAFIVSSGVKRNAPARNLTRRRMIEIVRAILPQIKDGYEIIFSHKLQNKKTPSFSDIKEDIEKLLKLSNTIST